jgi:hypothetical protein
MLLQNDLILEIDSPIKKESIVFMDGFGTLSMFAQTPGGGIPSAPGGGSVNPTTGMPYDNITATTQENTGRTPQEIQATGVWATAFTADSVQQIKDTMSGYLNKMTNLPRLGNYENVFTSLSDFINALDAMLADYNEIIPQQAQAAQQNVNDLSGV